MSIFKPKMYMFPVDTTGGISGHEIVGFAIGFPTFQLLFTGSIVCKNFPLYLARIVVLIQKVACTIHM